MSDTNATGNRLYKCSVCRLAGHNKKKCPSLTVSSLAASTNTVVPAVAEDADQTHLTEDSLAATNTTESPKQYKCGSCYLLLGEDHRICVFTRYKCSVEDWKAALIPVG